MPRIATLSFFLLIVAGFLYLGNLVIYEAVVLAFHITDTTQLLLLGVGLGFLTTSFIAATIIGNFYYNVFTRVYYLLSAVWIGFFTYVFIASIIYDVMIAISQSFISIGPVLFWAVLLVSMYGILNARKIIVTKISVSLPNLPSSWKDRKAVWISDVHLGQIHGFEFAQKIVARVSALSPDIIFVGGDLYDGTGAPDIPELTAPLKGLSAPLGVYFITGNHEEYGDRRRFLSAVESAGMRVLQDEMVEIDGLQLVGVDYQNASNATRFKDILSKLAINPVKASILLKHEPKDLDIAHAAGISFQISGHTHNAQMWPLSYIGQLVHNGFAYGLKRFKDMQVYTSSGTGTWGPPMRVGTDSEIVLLTFG
jgi:predicted MPP superfamily phosphohydrolase